jgi:predicted transcriptional regulator
MRTERHDTGNPAAGHRAESIAEEVEMSHPQELEPEFIATIKTRILIALAGEIGGLIMLRHPRQMRGDLDRIKLKLPDEVVESLAIPDSFWEEKARSIQKALESVQLSETVEPLPEKLPDNFPWDESAWRELQIISRHTRKVAKELLRSNLSKLDFDALENQHQLWQRLSVGKASLKLSKMQKQILAKLLEKIRVTKSPDVEWSPGDWFEALDPSKQAIYSRALQRLESRGLVVRQSINANSLDKTRIQIKRGSNRKTTHVRLTDLGIAIANRLGQND